MPPAATKSNYGKISLKFDPPEPQTRQGHVMSAKCEQPLNELTVHVYCMITQSFNTPLCKRNGITDKRTDGPIPRWPRQTFQAGHKNIG